MGNPLTVQDLAARLERIPRVSLALLPTPLDDAPRLARALGLGRLLIKRDDLTGLGLGGNKMRKMEFLMADALHQGADTIVTTAAAQSNMCRQAAASARKLGLEIDLILRGTQDEPFQGNLLLDHVFGARVHFIATTDPYSNLSSQVMQEVAADLVRRGKHPYIIDLRTVSAPLAALSYVAGGMELFRQLEAPDHTRPVLFVATGSGGTHAGLALAAEMLGLDWKIQGICVQRPAAEMSARVAQKVAEAAALLHFETSLRAEDIRTDDAYIGPAYGIPTPEGVEAMLLAGRTEGLVLDPTYSGKAFAGLVGHAHRGLVGPDDTVVFMHTGGAPGVFAHAAEIEALIPQAQALLAQERPAK